MFKIVLLRHGESEWNQQNLFTGWVDVPLSENGIYEAQNAGITLNVNNFQFDIAYTSLLKRAIQTMWYTLEALDQLWIPWEKSWRLNERHYGALQGLNKKKMAEKHGDDQVHEWRRSWKTRPPLLEKGNPMSPENHRRYQNIAKNELPLGESLEDTFVRVLPYWHNVIAPTIKEGKRILISGHGNSLRALIKYLDNIMDEDISNLEIPTGKPLVYELDEELKPIKHYYL
ncbi:2,3-diphosphoglycerate-dependent phosphoglycerate mutase [Sunxiuqinia indica]|uniref:2,3-diphosphoglycerate-dependent phosphoglycerate mutase n=1 Tax=Sunxiuqinia indica TaxID=2692584 RepID=UPI00135B10EC|nr:2,3-diphosphoglycerate-dependent phosphoglycerate mutase [Sunxiuqinia indica]